MLESKDIQIRLVVNRLSVSRHCCFFKRLCERRVSVTRPGDILATGTVLERQHALGDHFSGVGSNDVDTQDAVRLCVSEELDQTVGVEVGLCSRVGGEGEGADLVLDALLFQLGLVLAYPGDFRVGVHDGWDGVVVDVTVVLGDEFDGCDGFLLGLVCEHGSESAVANDADVRDLGAVFLVDDDAATVVDLEANVLKTETSSVWAATDSDEDDVGVEL